MKKHFISLIALICVAQMMWAGEVVPSTTLSTYYASINGKSGEAIRTALNQTIHSHTTVSYDNLKYLFKWTDTYDNAGVTIDDIYSYCDPAYTTTWCSGDCGYNREHSVPKSWFGEATPLYSDAFHLYPTNCYVNSYRGNEPYGECADGTKCTTNGVHAKGRKGSSTFPGYTNVGTVYELDDEFKGDLARTYFYMVTCYMSSNFTQAAGGRVMFTYSNGKAQLTQYSIDLLLKWHREDPVSNRELVRNEVIYGNETYNKGDYSQGNRNPFIDYPELAEYIWGSKAGQSVDLATLVSAYDGETPPPGPQPEKPKFGVNWSVNGEVQIVDSVVENTNIPGLPAIPVSCSYTSKTFMGWTDAAIDGIADEAPVLRVTPADFPPVTEDVTYYAVFAKAETVEYGPQLGEVEFVFTQTVTSVEQDGVTILFDKGTNANNAPKYYETGDAMRCYGGNTITVTADGITQVVFEYGTGGNSNTITANTGSFDTDTWTGNADEVIFTIGGTSGHRRIHAMTVTRNSTGEGTIYSRFITNCQTGTEVELRPIDEPARKILVGDRIYIQLGEALFTLTGQRVR